jgi:chemotaxis protein CheD
VCLYDAEVGIGGMNHYLLPHGPQGSLPDCRYGVHAIPQLIQRCIAKGARQDHMIAKVFGGGSMQVNSSDPSQRVGQLNIIHAVEELTMRNIMIASQDVGGRFARDIRFDITTGSVRVKRMLVGEAPKR